jgi:hypothetical protein
MACDPRLSVDLRQLADLGHRSGFIEEVLCKRQRLVQIRCRCAGLGHLLEPAERAGRIALEQRIASGEGAMDLGGLRKGGARQQRKAASEDCCPAGER